MSRGSARSARVLHRAEHRGQVRVGGGQRQHAAGADQDPPPGSLRDRLATQARPLPRDLFWLGRALDGQGRREEAAAPLRAARQGWQEAEPDSPELTALAALLAA